MLSFACFFAFVCAASAIPSPGIVRNSERLALNLPPLPPKFARLLPGHTRDIDGPTHVQAAKRSAASAKPVSYSGRIQVKNSEDSVLGFLWNSAGFHGPNHINFLGHDEDLHVTIHTTSAQSGPIDIAAIEPQWNGSSYIGAGNTSPVLVLESGSANKISFVPVEQTPENSPPVVAGEGLKGESKIWSINPQNKEITAQWINPDGTKPTTVLAYDIRENEVFFVGDLKAYNVAFQDTPASEVRFFLVP